MRRFLPTVLCLVLALAPAFAQAATREARLVVLGISAGEGLTPKQVGTLDETLLTALSEAGLPVMGLSDVQRTLGFERTREALGCQDDNCAAEIAGSLGARFLLAADIGKLGRVFVVNAKVIDARKGAANIRAMRSCETTDELAKAIRDIASEVGDKLRDAGFTITPVEGPADELPAAPSRAKWELLLRGGFGGNLGIFGVGLEYRRGLLSAGLGTGTYALSGGVGVGPAGGGWYVDLHAVLARSGPLMALVPRHEVVPGYGFGLTGGWDFRPTPRLSAKLGAGLGWNEAYGFSTGRVLVFDGSLGLVF